MTARLSLLLALLARSALSHSSVQTLPRLASIDVTDIPRPLVVAHRGSSGTHPEHTLESYRRAVEDGADYIECDVTLSRDLVPICIHESSLSRTTDVASRAEFIDKRRNLTIPGEEPSYDWFAIDFTVEELKKLRKRQATSSRDPSLNWLYTIPTLEEFILLSLEGPPGLGIYPELKNPAWLNALPMMNGSRFEDIVLDMLSAHGFTDEQSPCILQSFSQSSLQYLSTQTNIRLSMLIVWNASDSTLDAWKSMGINGLGVSTTAISKHYNVRNDYKNWIRETTNLIERAHARGMEVHIWTMKNEDRYLAWDFEQDIHKFVDYFLMLRTDGIFTDYPGTLSRYLDLLYPEKQGTSGALLSNRNPVPVIGCAVLMAYFYSFTG